MIKKIGIPIAAAAVIFAIILTIDFDDSVSLDELPQNTYSITPVTSPIKVTTQTVEPLSIQAGAETQTAEKTISENYSYSGAGFVFPFLQKSFGISASTTIINVDDWNTGFDKGNSFAVKDESGGTFDGNVYAIAETGDETIYSLNPSTDVLTTWTIPTATAHGRTPVVDDDGQVFFTKASFGTPHYIGMLDPSTDQITLWDVGVAQNNHQLIVEPVTDLVYVAWGTAPSIITSLNPATNELKTWSVGSICPQAGSFAFHGMSIDTNGIIYANQLERLELCTLNPTTNQVTLYDTELDYGRTWHQASDPTNPGHTYHATNHSTSGHEIVRIDTINDESTVWTLTGQFDSADVAVDSNGLVWVLTTRNSAGSASQGIVMLNPATNSVTEWTICTNCVSTGLFTAANGDIWMYQGTPASGVTDHFVRLYQ